jgi:ribosome-associated toxin RatA of RatAB toxin-antitoxin module
MVALVVPERYEVPGDWLTVSLPRCADACYALFCDIERVPEWLPAVSSSVVTERDDDGRAIRVAFQASLRRATVGYTCVYRYRADDLQVAFTTSPRSSIVVRGMAHFQPVASNACLMTYGLDLRVGRGLPPFADPTFATHASSATLADFREFAIRSL